MRPTGNAQGNYYYFSLSTGRIINQTNATSLTMPDDVIDRVQKIARRQKANHGLIYADRNQLVNTNDDDDESEDESYNPVMDTKSEDEDSNYEDEPDHGANSDADESDYDPQDSRENDEEGSDSESDINEDATENSGVKQELEALDDTPTENAALENAQENPGVALENAPEIQE